MEDKISGGSALAEPAARPNFPASAEDGFVLSLEETEANTGSFEPLRAKSGSGKSLSLWALRCRTEAGVLAGGCAVAFPARDDAPSPRHMPHPVLGEWISALRYTGHAWIECGLFSVVAGFSEEKVTGLLWDGLQRLMRRNGTGFLVGTAPLDSLAFDAALRRGARALEPHSPHRQRYFLYVE